MKRRSFKEIGRLPAFALSVALSALVFLSVSFISAIASGFFANSRAGAEYLTLVTILCSGFISGFVSRRLLSAPLPAVLSMGVITLIFAGAAAILSGYSLGAFMNQLTFLLVSLVGIFAARERKARRRRR
jgi:CHASE2 domain-containing sensor protein